MRLTDVPILSRGGWLGLGHVRELRGDLLGILRRFDEECGALGRFNFPGQSLLVVNSPALIDELLVAKAKSFRKSKLLRGALFPLLGDGLFTSEGELWRAQRKLMAPIFQPAHLDGFAACMVESALRCADRWHDGAEIDIAAEATRITMAIAGKTLFDAETLDEADELGHALAAALGWSAQAAASLRILTQVELAGAVESVGERLGGGWRQRALGLAARLEQPILWPIERDRLLQRALEVLDRRVGRMIDDRRNGTDRADLLSRLLGAKDGGTGMSDRQLRDEIVTLFVAGHETTATALAWAFYFATRDASVRARLDAEVAALGGRPPTAADLPRLGYATRVFKEALRIYPPVPIYERMALEPVTIGGVDLEPGNYASIFPWALHHRPELWPEPERFDPDRFTPAAEEARPRHAWLPFGAGPRVCSGAHFALMEGPLVMAALWQRVSFELCEDREIGIDPDAATLRPHRGIRMRVRLAAPHVRAATA
jgi:cytochrome P450